MNATRPAQLDCDILFAIRSLDDLARCRCVRYVDFGLSRQALNRMLLDHCFQGVFPSLKRESIGMALEVLYADAKRVLLPARRAQLVTWIIDVSEKRLEY